MMLATDSHVNNLLAISKNNKLGSTKEFAEKLYHVRVGSRPDASTHVWLNHLLKNRIHELEHHLHPLYLELLNNQLSTQQIQDFISEYYWGSGYGFQREVINEAYKLTSNKLFKNYLKTILKEEQQPRQHYIIFTEFIHEIGMKVLPRKEISRSFSKKQFNGYNNDINYAFGYALGIEVEADYQISLLCCALSKRYEKEITNNEFFEIHIDPTGEIAHAAETCESINELLLGDNDHQKIMQGFDQAIIDTGNFLSEIHETLQ